MNRRRTIVAVGAAIVAAAVGGVAWRGMDGAVDADEAGDEGTPSTTAAVTMTDLATTTEYGGTLGRTPGQPLTARADGTVTSTPEPGEVIDNGDIAYSIDGKPVVALIGHSPGYRTLATDPSPTPVAADGDGDGEGVITWLPEPGAVLGAGDVAFEVDGQPVVVIDGDVPPYRELTDMSDNLTGDDVAQLERNLDQLGFAEPRDVTVDDEFTAATERALDDFQEAVGLDDDGALAPSEFVVLSTPSPVMDINASVGDRVGGDSLYSVAGGEPMSGPDVAQLNAALVELGYLEPPEDATEVGDVFDASTEAAVRALQTDLGMEVDGSLDIGEYVFLAEPIRVGTVSAPAGTSVAAGTAVLDVTSPDTIVTFDLPASDQGLLEHGQQVEVELPDGTDLPATVTSVAEVATETDSGAVFDVEVEIDDQQAASGLDEAPVDVSVVTDSASDVVAVPVAALVALREGGYAVELVDGDTTRLVAVDAGFFADGLVAISGEVAAGDRVVMP